MPTTDTMRIMKPSFLLWSWSWKHSLRNCMAVPPTPLLRWGGWGTPLCRLIPHRPPTASPDVARPVPTASWDRMTESARQIISLIQCGYPLPFTDYYLVRYDTYYGCKFMMQCNTSSSLHQRWPPGRKALTAPTRINGWKMDGRQKYSRKFWWDSNYKYSFLYIPQKANLHWQYMIWLTLFSIHILHRNWIRLEAPQRHIQNTKV